MGGGKNTGTTVKRAKRTARRRSQSRTEILDVAREVVVRDGYLGFSLGAVAAELGLTKPALYYYFNSKKALMFELLLCEWVDAAREVEAAVEATETGADAVEALMRTVFSRYRDQLALFLLVHQRPRSEELEDLVGPEELERLRPVNDLLYGGAEARLRADQKADIFPKDRDPRRFAFTAHTTVLGLLTMKAMVEAANDPLVHSDDDLVEDICRTYRNAATRGGLK